tara:strand:+ start:563 stop:883 length:321 start_codon:yes stop_codon:yes gene_type:complete
MENIEKLLEDNYDLVQIAKGNTEQAKDFIDTVETGINRIQTTGDHIGKTLMADDISYAKDRLDRALYNISWIKKRLPHQLVESVFRDIDSYENRATKILENISKEV